MSSGMASRRCALSVARTLLTQMSACPSDHQCPFHGRRATTHGRALCTVHAAAVHRTIGRVCQASLRQVYCTRVDGRCSINTCDLHLIDLLTIIWSPLKIMSEWAFPEHHSCFLSYLLTSLILAQ